MSRWGSGAKAIAFVVAVAAETIFFHRAVAARAQSSDSTEFYEGQIFPAMVFPSLDGGRPGSVADFRGKKVILHIFASW